MSDTEQIEQWAAENHDVYLEVARRRPGPLRPEVAVPYAELPESEKEINRAVARWALSKQSTTLGWVLLDDLLEEIRRRFGTVIFAAIEDLQEGVAQEYLRIKGDFRRCQGLATGLIFMVQQRITEAMHESKRVDD